MICHFDSATFVGILGNASTPPSPGQFAVDIAPAIMGDFLNTPERYQYQEGTFSELSSWLKQKPAIDIKSMLAQGEIAMQGKMDAYAHSWGYDSLTSCLSYLSSTNGTWKVEAGLMNSWRDEVWMWANAEQATILADQSKMPSTMEDFLSGMPVAPSKP